MDDLLTASAAYNIERIAGPNAILHRLPALAQAASAWQQEAAFNELPFCLSIPGRHPLLLLLTSAEDPSRVLGAVFTFAFGHQLFGTRLLSNADRFGRVGVFGPSANRVQIAAAAAQFLLDTGSALVRLSYQPEPSDLLASAIHDSIGNLQTKRPGEQWALRSDGLFVDLTLCPDLDSTLAQLGRRTRRNVREAMRSCRADLGCSFVVDAHVSLEEYLSLNRLAARTVSSRVARWRYEQSRQPAAFLSGVQTASGQWLALAGGRLCAGTLIVDWQLNDLSFARYSPSLLMRGFLIQHFGATGATALLFAGGSAHQMTRHFNKRTVHSLQARRTSAWLRLLGALMQRCLPSKAITRILFGYG